MCIVDLDDVELLHDPCVNLQLVALELRNDLLAQVNGNDLKQELETVDFSLRLKVYD